MSRERREERELKIKLWKMPTLSWKNDQPNRISPKLGPEAWKLSMSLSFLWQGTTGKSFWSRSKSFRSKSWDIMSHTWREWLSLSVSPTCFSFTCLFQISHPSPPKSLEARPSGRNKRPPDERPPAVHVTELRLHLITPFWPWLPGTILGSLDLMWVVAGKLGTSSCKRIANLIQS